jgi:Na+-translocating ferredoxin:NAD+ oxidoreductase RnfG subunit
VGARTPVSFLGFLSMIRVSFAVICFLFLSLASTSFAKVYLTRDEALELAFPDADMVDKKVFFLTDDQVKEIESLSRTKVDSKIFVYFVGKKGEKVLGYAVIDTHTVRTKSETVMVVINQDGTVKQVEILAFFEPPDYMPGEKWLELFQDKKLSTSLRLGGDIPRITGATITSNTIVKVVRRILATFQVVTKGVGIN